MDLNRPIASAAGGAATLFGFKPSCLSTWQRGDVALSMAILTAPTVRVLCPVTFSIALPWLRLRKVPVEIETPSNHVALSKFDYGVTPFAGSSTTISRNPLIEWHAFANVPSPNAEGFRLTISRAGDWDRRPDR